MSQAKRIMEEEEQNRRNKLKGYRKMLHRDNIYAMDCPYCCEALSNEDIKESNCVHCGYKLLWNTKD